MSVSAINALCPNCNQIKQVEACVHCYQPLCTDCINHHVDQWRLNSIKYCDTIDKKVEKYLNRIESLNPLIVQNKFNLEKAKSEVEDLFQNFMNILNDQKNDLFNKLDEIDKENEKFKCFETDIINLRNLINEFQQSATSPTNSMSSLTSNDQNLTEKEKIMNQFKKFHYFREQVHKIGTNYTGLKKRPFKIIGEYERPSKSIFDLFDEKNLFGNLIINESDLLKAKEQASSLNFSKRKAPTAPPFESPLIPLQQDPPTPPSSDENSRDDGKVHMFGTLRVKLKRLVELNDLNTVSKYPSFEFNLNIQPKLLACFANSIFICDDESGNLAIAELEDTFKMRSINKLNLQNQIIKSIAVNRKYLAISLSEVNKEKWQSISKYYNYNKLDNQSKCGIVIFRLNEQLNAISFEKIITTSANKSNFNLITPNSIALSLAQSQSNDLFVSDRESHTIFRIDVKSGNLISKLILKNNLQQEPTGMCLTERHLIYVDSYKLEINVCDISSNEFILVRNFKIFNSLDDGPNGSANNNVLFNEPFFDICYSKSSNLIFLKNRADSKVIIYDYNSTNANTLTLKYSFDYDYSNFQSISYLRLVKKSNKNSSPFTDDYFVLAGFNNIETKMLKLGLFSNF